MTSNSLKISSLDVHFFTLNGIVHAVDGVNLSIGKGKIVALVGESGCGKSTVAYSVLGLVPNPGKIVGGEILLNGENLLEKSGKEMQKIRGKKISMIFQEPSVSLNPCFKVENQIAEALKGDISSKNEISEKVYDILNSTGIPDPKRVAKSYPHQLSGGMQQRVMIAMAMVHRPELLLADEPTTSLDVTIQAQILKKIKELAESLNLSVLLITHDFGIVSWFCEEVAVMYAGSIVERASSAKILAEPKHPYTRALLKSIPVINKKTEHLSAIGGTVPSLLNPPAGCSFCDRCKNRLSVCRKIKPRMVEAADGMEVACHLYT